MTVAALGRVPPPVELPAEALRSFASLTSSPSSVLEASMSGMHMDADRANAIIKNILEPSYGLREYYEDVIAAFPELRLFGLEKMTLEGLLQGKEVTSGGRGPGDEFQRTIGAFFAIYWLVRIDMDGKIGFCYGVNGSWKPVHAGKNSSTPAGRIARYEAFYGEEQVWSRFMTLMLDAGVLVQEGSKMVVDEKAMLALLILTALHDIMRIDVLLPTVQKADSPYCCHSEIYKEGEIILDHDVAISYMIDCHAHLLPSLRNLEPSVLASVKIVLSGLSFNNGWFVQAEAPPGAIFKGIKMAFSKDSSSQPAGNPSKQEFSLYFIHWLTDLAGAEPNPLQGCHKLTCRLPLHVFLSFMNSLKYIQMLADNSETDVMEMYLKDRWQGHQPTMGPLPEGPHALVKARIMCMAQGMTEPMLDAFSKLSEEDRELLCEEMSHTSCENQSFSAGFVPSKVRERLVGPAFLVYYGPAFLQRGNDNPFRRLEILAEIYRKARAMWPASEQAVGAYVTVRIDSIAIHGTWSVSEPDVLVLRKLSGKQGVIERHPQMGDPGGPVAAENIEVLFSRGSRKPMNFCSQEEMVSRIGPHMEASGKWHRKVGVAFLRSAVPGEVVVTIVDNKEETVNTAGYGDFVVQANTNWKENYILSRATVLVAYDLANPIDIQSDHPDSNQLAQDGYRCYRSRTRIKTLTATTQLLDEICPDGRFMAKWGAPVPVEINDTFAAQIHADGHVVEVYRIEKTVFEQTFVADE